MTPIGGWLLAAAFYTLSLPVLAQPQFRVVVIEELPDVDLSPREFNDLGQMAGSFQEESALESGPPIDRLFLWLPEAFQGLPVGFHPLGTLGGESGRVTGLNQQLKVCGWSDTGEISGSGAPIIRGFRWQEGLMEPFGNVMAGYSGGSAEGINSAGEIVGVERHPFACQAWIWLPKSAYGLPGGLNHLMPSARFFEAGAMGINDRGHVVGFSTPACDTFSAHATLWLPEPAYGLPAGIHDLTPNISISDGYKAFEINNNGVVIGEFLGEYPLRTGAFRWSQGVLHHLAPLAPDTHFIVASGLNDAGLIVGRSDSRGVLWHRDKVYALDELLPQDPGWLIGGAVDTNNRGQILAEGSYQGGETIFVRLDPLKLFADGFESGGTTSWTSTVGGSLREGAR